MTPTTEQIRRLLNAGRTMRNLVASMPANTDVVIGELIAVVREWDEAVYPVALTNVLVEDLV